MGNVAASTTYPTNSTGANELSELDQLSALRKMAAVEIEMEREERILAGYPIPPSIDALLTQIFAELQHAINEKQQRAAALRAVHAQLRLRFGRRATRCACLAEQERRVVHARHAAVMAALQVVSPTPASSTCHDTLALVREYIERRGAVAAVVDATTAEQSARVTRNYFVDRVGNELQAVVARRAAAHAASDRRAELVVAAKMTDVLCDIARRGRRRESALACAAEQARRMQLAPSAAGTAGTEPLSRAVLLGAVRRLGVRRLVRPEMDRARHQHVTRTSVLPQLTAVTARATSAAACEQERRHRLRQRERVPPPGLPLVHDQLRALHARRTTAQLVSTEAARARHSLAWQAVGSAIERRAARQYAAAACRIEQQARINRAKLAVVMEELHHHCIRTVLAHATAQARRDHLVAYTRVPFAQRAAHAAVWALVPV